MATSGSTDYAITANEIVEDVLRGLGIVREDESPNPGDSKAVMRVLNRMVKAWQNDNLHLWTKQTATLFLQKSQNTYALSSASSDHATIDYEQTTLDADYAAGVSQVGFNNAVSAAINDYIGIELDTGSLFWTTIANVVDTTTVDLNDVLPSQASASKLVYIYTTKLETPFNVLAGLRSTRENTDLELLYNSYNQYFLLPNKESLSVPTIYNYDRQRDVAIIRVWPTPADVEYKAKFTILRKIQDFDSVSNNPDFPQEWYDAVITNLRVKVAPYFGKIGTQRYQDLKAEALEALNSASSFDNEQGSIYNQVDRRYYDEY